MTYRFRVKEIARQAGLGTATVDRVLNNRPHVSPQTRNRVQAAIRELEHQEQQLSARGRRLFVDFVVEAPRRFSSEILHATEVVLPSLGYGVFRPRFLFQEEMSDADIASILERILKRGSHGICLKARDVPVVRRLIDRLVAAGIPVVTLVTDIPKSDRLAYVGLDNANAGRTAAYLIAGSAGAGGGQVLTTRSQDTFFGEAERLQSFCRCLKDLKPGFEVLDISGGAGLDASTSDRLSDVFQNMSDLRAVYSVGGGNEAIVDLLKERGHMGLCYIAHDLDRDNRRLIEGGMVSFLLHHDLRTDMRNVFLAIAAWHRLMPATPERLISDVQIVTPYNMPAGVGCR